MTETVAAGRARQYTDPADLGVLAAVELLRAGLSAAELVEACLRRIDAGTVDRRAPTGPGRDQRFGAVYAESRSSVRVRPMCGCAGPRDLGTAPPLCGIPIGMKDLYAVTGRQSRRQAGCWKGRGAATTAARCGGACAPRGWC